MDFQGYINQKRNIYDALLSFFEETDDANECFQNLIVILTNQKISENREELKSFLHLLLQICNNIHRSPNFNSKIQQIIHYFEDNIKQTFSNSELFNIFKSSKQILLILFQNNLIFPDDSIAKYILAKKDKKESKYSSYCHFFYPEIKPFIDSKVQEELDIKNFDNFDKNRQLGQNESYVCSLIRNDSIEEFVSYASQANLPLSKGQIEESIFETNLFLLNKKPTFIEYSAFFGAVQIFKYLQMNEAKLSPSLWPFVIHSNNAELIHILEDNHISPEDETFEVCLEEAIKCHHNKIANYIESNFLNSKIEESNLKGNIDKNCLSYGFHYYNYEYLPNDATNEFILFYLARYNYVNLVEILLKEKPELLNKRIKIKTIHKDKNGNNKIHHISFL